MTIRKLMIAVAIIAAAMAPLMWAATLLRQLNTGLQDLYGKGGILDLRQQISNEKSGGDKALGQGHYVEAEARYRASLRLCDTSRSKQPHGFLSEVNWQTAEAEIGLANALVGQGRYDEAGLLYSRILTAREKSFGLDHFAIAEVLERYAAFLRRADRVSEAKELEARALRILDRYIETQRQNEQSTYWKEAEVRAQAIRSRLLQ